MNEEEIDEIGIALEHGGMSDEEIDKYFEHAGTKGMKWGVRRGKGKTGVGRFGGAKTDINDRRIYRREQMNKGKYKGLSAAGTVFMGGPARQKRMRETTINKLKTQNKRIKSGKTTVTDKLGIYAGIPLSSIGIPVRGPSISGLIVSRKPKKL